MDIFSLINDLLSRADLAAYAHWNIIGPILDAIIPDAAANYRP